MSEYNGVFADTTPEYETYAAAGGTGGYNSPQYSQYLADQRAAQDLAYEQSPEGQRMQEYHQQRALARKSDKGTFNIIAGIFAAVAVVLSGGTLLGVFGPAAAALEGGAAAAGAAAGGLEGAVAAGVAEGAIEAGAATAAVAEAAPAVAAVEAGGAIATGGAEVAGGAAAAGAAEAAAPTVFSQIIDGATSVYNAVSGAVESVGSLTNISGPIGEAVTEATGLNPTIADLGAKTLVGAGRGALTSAIQGQDPGLGALGGAAGGLVSAGSKELLGAAGLGSTGFEGGIKGTLSSALGGGASGAARAAASGGDVGAAALRGLATGGASGAANYLLSDALGLGNAVGSLGGSLASSFVGSALAPDTSTVSRGGPTVIRMPRPTTPGPVTARPTAPGPSAPDPITPGPSTPGPSTPGPTGGISTNLSGLLGLGGSGSSGGGGGSGISTGGTGISGVYGTSGATGASGVTTSGTPTTISTSALASLLSSPSDPGYSSPLSDNTEPSSSQPSPWNRSSLRTTDPLGSSYG